MRESPLKTMLKRYPTSKISEQTKIRELLQQAALLGLERHGFFEKAAFYGGAALRILYGLDRFSEDLDFTLLKPTPEFEFAPFLEGMKRELTSWGFSMGIAQKSKTGDTTIVSAFMKMNTIQLYLSLEEQTKPQRINHNEKIQIKLEVDTDPPPLFRVENQLILNPVSFYVLTLHKSDLFAGKMHAILCRAWKERIKGRDWYDLIWYVQNKVPLNLAHLEARMRQTGHWTLPESLKQHYLHELLKDRIERIDWENAKEDMRPFIADPSRLEIWSARFFSDLLAHLVTEQA